MRTEGADQAHIDSTVGPCHLHAWNHLLAAVSALFTEEENEKTIKITNYSAKVAGMSNIQERLLYLMEEIKYTRICKTHSSSYKRLEVAFGYEAEARPLFLQILRPKILSQEGTRLLAGQAPPGDLERTLQRYLDNMK